MHGENSSKIIKNDNDIEVVGVDLAKIIDDELKILEIRKNLSAPIEEEKTFLPQ